MQNETGGMKGCESIKGTSREVGCLQYQKSTFDAYSKETLGYVAPFDLVNQRYVASLEVQKWLTEGHSPAQAMLYWNSGEGQSRCSKGTNKYKVKYDSCAYVKSGMNIINQFIAYAK